VLARFGAAALPDRLQILALGKLVPGARAQIVAVARREPDPAMRAYLIDWLASQDGYDAADITPCLQDKDPLVRAAAAIALGCTKGPGAPRDVIGALDEAIRGWREIAARFAELPYTEGHVLANLAVAAGAIRTPDARSLAQRLCAALDQVDAASAAMYGRGLLALALGTGERPFAKRVIEILAALAASKQFWAVDAGARDVLERWRLPVESAELQALVHELERAPDAEARLHAKISGPR
jgi:hypothetical protein